jgi:protein tyrosine phosphatase (PTP) superfamily phosphohydrolase (DUF442 family)
MPSTPRLPALLLLALGALAGCGTDEGGTTSPTATSKAASTTASTGPRAAVPAPLPEGEAAYEIAGSVALAEVEPDDGPDLHNVFRLSENIVSGGEPHGEEALKKIADMGVKTVLSVDGKVPDEALAAKYGLRYVHVPIQYSGIDVPARLHIAKTFRELEGPFYVHCFHGKHRGPAAAAIGRMVLDGATREQAVAEMRQWCGTSGKYAGLYETIARAPLPTPEDTDAIQWDFPAAHEFKGIRHAMIGISRIHDHLKALSGRGWTVDPNHPDLNAANETAQLVEIFKIAKATAETEHKPDDYRGWMGESVTASEALLATLREMPLGYGEIEPWVEAATAGFDAVNGLCSSCHQVYRNN